MNIHEKVSLIQEIETVHMFPAKYQEPDSKALGVGAEGIITEVFPSGAGIVDFNGLRVLFTQLEKKVKVVKDKSSKKLRLSRKQLTEEEALQKLSHLSMQLQTEKEGLLINYYPNRNKSWSELDRALQFCLSADGFKSMQECIETTEQRIRDIEWKMNEDYGRFVSKGVHVLSSGHVFIKR